MRRAVLIYNPMSGRRSSRRVLPAVAAELRWAGFEIEELPTSGPGDATRLAREASARGDVEVAFAFGGDGTLREVAAGLLGSEVALGPLPAGTANVLSLALGLPRRALPAARVLVDCVPRPIDVGTVDGEPFLMCATGGLDAAVMAEQDGDLKKILGKGAMVAPTIHQWWSYDYPEIELEVDGRSLEASYFAVCNIPYYAGAFRMAPDADLEDGKLDLIAFRGRGRLATLGLMRDLALGRHVHRSDVEARRIERVEIRGPRHLRLQIDGDIPELAPPVRIAVASDRLWVLRPRA